MAGERLRATTYRRCVGMEVLQAGLSEVVWTLPVEEGDEPPP